MNWHDFLRGFAKSFPPAVIAVLSLSFASPSFEWFLSLGSIWAAAKALSLVLVVILIIILCLIYLTPIVEWLRKVYKPQSRDERNGISIGAIIGTLIGCFMLYVLK